MGQNDETMTKFEEEFDCEELQDTVNQDHQFDNITMSMKDDPVIIFNEI